MRPRAPNGLAKLRVGLDATALHQPFIRTPAHTSHADNELSPGVILAKSPTIIVF